MYIHVCAWRFQLQDCSCRFYFDGFCGRYARSKIKSSFAETCPQVKRLITFPVLRAFAGFCFCLLGFCGCFAVETAPAQCVTRAVKRNSLVVLGRVRCLRSFYGQTCQQQKLHEIASRPNLQASIDIHMRIHVHMRSSVFM